MPQTPAESPDFQEWAIVELFGHDKMAGKVTDAPIGDLLRIDVVNQNDETLYTRYVNPDAVFAINPCSEDLAKAAANRFSSPPVKRWQVEDLLPDQGSEAEQPEQLPSQRHPSGPNDAEW